MVLKEVVDPDSGRWKRYIAVRGEWGVSVGGLMSEYQDELFAAMVAGEPVLLVFRNVDGTTQYDGQALFESLTQTGTVKEIGTYQCKLMGTGKLEVNDF